MHIEIDTSTTRTATWGFISYERLIEQLRASGELNPDETIISLRITNHGIEYSIEYVKEKE